MQYIRNLAFISFILALLGAPSASSAQCVPAVLEWDLDCVGVDNRPANGTLNSRCRKDKKFKPTVLIQRRSQACVILPLVHLTRRPFPFDNDPFTWARGQAKKIPATTTPGKQKLFRFPIRVQPSDLGDDCVSLLTFNVEHPGSGDTVLKYTRAVHWVEDLCSEQEHRDEERLTDMQVIADALQRYWRDQAMYPPEFGGVILGGAAARCLSSGNGFASSCSGVTYLDPVPANPVPNGADYVYLSLEGQSYTVTSILEGPTDGYTSGVRYLRGHTAGIFVME